MKTACIFSYRGSKAIRLPQAWIGDASEVVLEHKGNDIIVRPLAPDLWKVAEECAALGTSKIERLSSSVTGVRVKL